MGAGADTAGGATSTRRKIPGWVKGVASLALAAALLVGVLPQFADLGEVWDTITAMTFWEVVVLVLAAVWNIITYQFVMMAALPGLKWRHAFMAGQITTAIANTVPAGGIVGIGFTYAVLSSFGHRSAPIALTAIITGFWNIFAKLAMPMVAMLVLAVNGRVNEGLLTGAVAGLVTLAGAVIVLVLVVSSERLARAIGSRLERLVNAARSIFGHHGLTGWEESFARFRWRSADLLKRRWHVLTLATAASHLSLYWVLLTALRDVGVEPTDVHWAEVLGVYAFVQLVTALPLTPGGIGLIEVGMSAGLVLAGGSQPKVVAAVLVYRALTYLLQVLLGVLSYGLWRTELRLASEAESLASEEA